MRWSSRNPSGDHALLEHISADSCIQKRLLRSCLALQENSVCHGLWQSVICSGGAASLRLARGDATRLRFARMAKASPDVDALTENLSSRGSLDVGSRPRRRARPVPSCSPRSFAMKRGTCWGNADT